MKTPAVVTVFRKAVQKFWLQQQLNQIDLNFCYQQDLAREYKNSQAMLPGVMSELEKLEAERERVLGCLKEFA